MWLRIHLHAANAILSLGTELTSAHVTPPHKYPPIGLDTS
jgi:hypothetical protein